MRLACATRRVVPRPPQLSARPPCRRPPPPPRARYATQPCEVRLTRHEPQKPSFNPTALAIIGAGLMLWQNSQNDAEKESEEDGAVL